jgi:DNA-binding transcriptional MerR regulator
MYTTGNFAKMIGVTVKTLHNWDKNYFLKPSMVINKRRLYTHELYKQYMKENFNLNLE